MIPEDSVRFATYELPANGSVTLSAKAGPQEIHFSLPSSILVKNIFWFCRVRWTMIVLLVVFGVFSFLPGRLCSIDININADWAYSLAGILGIGNIIFLWHARQLKQSAEAHSAAFNIWGQIILDLLVVTAVVHFIGSLETYVHFLYLFHVVLACIFFSRYQSLAVTAIASLLYVVCVSVEIGFDWTAGIYTDMVLRKQLEGLALVNVISTIAIWLGVWGLASRLSGMVRDQANEVAKTNHLLVKTQEEKTKNLLRTTHELKAPFAAIQMNTQLLLRGECGVLPDKALEIVGRIAERSRWLTFEIQEMLQLANLRTSTQKTLQWKRHDLAEALKWCIIHVQPMAHERGIIFDEEIKSACVVAVEEHIKMLFTNLLSNAIIYSHRGGRVCVRCGCDSQERRIVTIEDHGIGIPANKLPRIFDDYYRTNEALRHNKMSTGLGLSIVRHVADSHRIRVRVESLMGKGTKFDLLFPPPF